MVGFMTLWRRCDNTMVSKIFRHAFSYSTGIKVITSPRQSIKAPLLKQRVQFGTDIIFAKQLKISPLDEIRYDGVDHLPLFSDHKNKEYARAKGVKQKPT